MSKPEQEQLELLLSHINNTLGNDLLAWPGGWPHDIEAALIDAIFSIRARYGTPTTGVRAVVHRWLKHRGGQANDLSALAGSDPDEVRSILMNNAKASGRYKAEVVIEASRRLAAAQLTHAADFMTGSEHQLAEMKSAYLSVKGCGPVTWHYFGMLLGRPDSKPDTWIMRYVRNALNDPTVSTEDARALITEAAEARGVNISQLDHSIWAYARAQ